MIRLATLLVWLLALLPSAVAMLTVIETQWHSPTAVLGALGRLAGVAGLSFLLVAASLSSRVPGFDRAFGGLTKLWQTHHRLASVAFLLLLAHPLLLAFASGGDSGAAVGVLFPATAYWEVWAGWGALLAMMIFLAPSFAFFGEPKYQRWKFLHRLAGLAIVLALLHALPLARAIPHPWDYVIWLTLTVLALAAVTYRWLFSRSDLPGVGGRFPYRVTEVNKVANDVVEISAQAVDRHLQYRAGQFVYLTSYDRSLSAGYGEEHPYTLSSSPDESQLRITIKDLGDASRAMQTIKSGSDLRVEGPYGAFFESEYDEDSELWIAGGIGITPFLGRARFLRETCSEVDVCLIYCVQDETRALFADQFREIAEQLPGFNFQLHYFYQQGPLNMDFIQTHCPNYTNRGAYICGPLPLLGLARKLLIVGGVPLSRIQTEEFNLL
ncbi:MAG: ferric reductase-like transmembrane domain-containing protein [Cellvibrionaceae bacterium]